MKIVIGEPPLGEQTHHVMVGKLKSGKAAIQTNNGWIAIEKEHLAGTVDALLAMCGDLVDVMTSEQIIEKWNDSADEFNQWESMGENEKIEFAFMLGRGHSV